MALDLFVTALSVRGHEVKWWYVAVAVAALGVAAVGGYFAFRALWPIVSKWAWWQKAGAAALVLGAIAAGAFALYNSNDRPEDVLNTNVDFERKEEPRKHVTHQVNWPVYGYNDQRTRYLPTKIVQPPFKSSDWSFQAGKLLEFPPVIIKDRLYFTDKDADVYAMDSGTGKVQWKKKVGALSAASPAIEDGRMFVVTLEPGDIQAMDPRSGRILWEKPLPARSETSPAIFGNKVIVGTEVGTVYAFNVKTGAVEWTVDTADAVKGGVAIDDGIAYFGNYAGELYAVNAVNGDIKWQTGTQGSSFGRTGRIYSTPTVAFGRVYVGSVDNRVYSFDQDNGALAWSHSTGDWVYSSPAVAQVPGAPPTVYIGSLDQNFYALDARDGSVRWTKDVGGNVIGAATVIGDVVYVGVIGPNIGTFGFDADNGHQVFEHELGEYNPVVSDGQRLYLTGSSGIRAFSPDLSPDKKKKGGGEKGSGGGGKKSGGGEKKG